MDDNTLLLDSIFLDRSRKIVVCKNDIDLSKKNDNTIFILSVEESSGSAGGRIGGAGFRRISKIDCFKITTENVQKIFETENEDIISNFEVPLSAVAMDIKLSNSTPKVIQGIVDEELVESYLGLIK
jgi:hypothetical protein